MASVGCGGVCGGGSGDDTMLGRGLGPPPTSTPTISSTAVAAAHNYIERETNGATATAVVAAASSGGEKVAAAGGAPATLRVAASAGGGGIEEGAVDADVRRDGEGGGHNPPGWPPGAAPRADTPPEARGATAHCTGTTANTHSAAAVRP
ncbi:hypothetical protein I4F81_007095 [Pyropia yezoensis]|uniref:Uncharacterized protein n=1 Tax=Pyropia yezoensis TaxID=2788 RepID=A0ACC3C3L3_PYRYE|nr:hypothetical protein I4F81_007095 [Neopyropia yezoensis]